ncbi:hypothetical protein CFP56_023760 [Quercus suber]|uniref:Uncharacterized protein n=1 Tax=Quercus suber TaxID=58331 RepID=A0AAW0K719_QUESU
MVLLLPVLLHKHEAATLPGGMSLLPVLLHKHEAATLPGGMSLLVVAVVVCDPTRFKPHGLPMPDPIWTKDDVLSLHSPSESDLKLHTAAFIVKANVDGVSIGVEHRMILGKKEEHQEISQL